MNNKTYVDVMVEDIKPDPRQPRKHVNKTYITTLAENIKRHGMIHPIVVDSDMKIIVGECRWRAAKELGLKMIKVVIEEEKMDAYERFAKQMSENSVRSSAPDKTGEEIPPVDMANAYARMLLIKAYKDAPPGGASHVLDYSDKELYRAWHDSEHGQLYAIVKQCAEDIGKDENTIRDYLNLLNEPEPILEAVNKKGVPRTYIREANRAPKEFQKKIKENIVAGKYGNREQITKAVEMTRKIPDAMREEINRSARSKIAEYILEAANKMLLVLVKVDLKKFSEEERTFIIKKLRGVADRIYDFCDGIKIDAYGEEKK
jgi:hypothetical protein